MSVSQVCPACQKMPELYKKHVGFYAENLSPDSGDVEHQDTRREAPMDEANLVSSKLNDGSHSPVIDLDLEAELVPSSSPNCYHLYIDRPMTWENYLKLLNVMAEVGLVQENWVKNSIERSCTMVRKPGVYK